jgi:erythrin-vacuolar iron transport family protein
MTFAEDLHDRYPSTAKVFEEIAMVEAGHHQVLAELYQKRFGSHILPIRRSDVNFFIKRPPVWLTKNLSLDTIRREAGLREAEAILTTSARAKEAKTSDRLFLLQYVQPGLVGLMDGSVSTLAPVFAAAFATHNNWQTFLVGLAASLGAGISMGFAEALSDDGSITGRGSPVLRGGICGLMTALGGIGHTLPYLVPGSIPNAFWIATSIAGVVVFCELWIIAFVRTRYMDTPFVKAALQIVLGGAIVLATGILIGAS